jgi:acyl-[acyl-carrier-protein]-phospholipid O-acyltransferase/long-chain-fatty-acid--[acyl-carrier-protein] ligase
LWPNALSAVVAVPDLRKGERLLLVTQQKGATRTDFMSFAKAKHASDLMIPSEVWVLDKLPLLGTGKVDMAGVASLVQERLAAKPETMARATG